MVQCQIMLIMGLQNLPSSLVDASLPSLPLNQPIWVVFRQSNFGTYGLMSKRGVPSKMSMSLMCRILFSIWVSCTVDIPMGLGLAGERVANTPWSLSSKKGLTIKEPLFAR